MAKVTRKKHTEIDAELALVHGLLCRQRNPHKGRFRAKLGNYFRIS